MLTEIGQAQRDKYREIPPTGGAWSRQIWRDRKQNGGCHGLWEGVGVSV